MSAISRKRGPGGYQIITGNLENSLNEPGPAGPTAGEALFAEVALAALRPPSDLKVSEWADEYRYLSPESAAEYGKWQCKPYQREPLDSISDPLVYRTVIKSATQLLKTEVILNGIGYVATQSPGPILVLQPRDSDVKAFSKERIAPMIRDTPALKEIFAESKSRVANNTLDEKLFTGGILAITAAGSAANLARRAIRYLFCDEVDKYPPSAGSEGNPISLARKRLATFRHRKKEIITCSPTIEGSEIDRAYALSDQRQYFIPCPVCGFFQSLILKFQKQVLWDSKLPTREEQAATALYYCEECGAPWDDTTRWTAVDRGEWRASKPFNGVAGFWISELYSPWKPLREIVLDYLSKKDSAEDLRTFINTSLAENWVEKGDAPEWEILLAKREPYEVGTVPAGGMFLTAGVDVQRDRLEVEVVAWGRGRESWSVDYQIIPGATSEPEVWKKLDELRAKTYETPNGCPLPILKIYVDSGDGTTTNQVYNWVRDQPRTQVTAIKGSDRSLLPVGQLSPVEVTVQGKKIKKGLHIRTINVSFFKAEFYGDLRKRPPTSEEQDEGFVYPPGYCHFPDGPNYGDEHFKQVCSEQLVTHTNRRTKRKKPEWHQTRPRNEALDCRIYARAAAWEVGLDRMQEKHWKNLEDQIQAAGETKQPAGKKATEKKSPGLDIHGERKGSFFGNTNNWFNR